MTKIVNFYAGPSAGKSTLAAQLFGHMKALRLNVEYAPEYAKDLTWKKSNSLDDQLYVLGKQHHRLYTLLDQVDYIITDSPLLLTMHYSGHSFKKFTKKPDIDIIKMCVDNMALALYTHYDNINFFVERGDRAYVTAGRSQSEDEAKVIDWQLKALLRQYKIPFTEVTSLAEVSEFILGQGDNESKPTAK
jgi:hypothetical protein